MRDKITTKINFQPSPVHFNSVQLGKLSRNW